MSGVVPDGAYLAGGTAIAVHLGHHQSADLDFFLRSPVDLVRRASSPARRCGRWPTSTT